MLSMCSAYLKELELLHNDIKKALEGLPQNALDWVPGSGMNSINVLVAHATGAERFLIGDLVGDIPSHRNRPAEFATSGLAGPALARLLDDALDIARDTFEKLTLADLESIQPRLKEGRSFTVAAAIVHAIAHTGTHLGHIELTRQLWEQKT